MLKRLMSLVLLLAPAADAQSGPWTDLGFALPGVNGLPHLVCKGPLAPGSGMSLSLDNAHVSAPAYLVIGASAIYAPYKGGVLVPNFDLLFILWTDDKGEVQVSSHWPNDVPSGFTFYLQYWINDDAAVAKRAGSNAVKGVVP